MNFTGKFDPSFATDESVALGAFRFDSTSVAHGDERGSHVVPDSHLLFAGDFKRVGSDLIISDDHQQHIVRDYFTGDNHPSLMSKDGGTLSGAVVDALTGHTLYAQAAPTSDADGIGKVMKMTGSASVVRNGVTVDLSVNDVVRKGDVIQTGSGSSIGVTFVDGTTFGMESNARMVLNELVYDPQGSSNSSLFSLVQGTITFVAGKTAKNGNMRVDTPVATMGIRGTAVLVEISADNGPTKFSVLMEPDGTTGSYNLYDKLTGLLIGTVSQAGQVTLVSFNNGQTNATEQAKTLADQQAVQAAINKVFELAFPNFNNQDANPKTDKSGGSDVSPLNNATAVKGIDPETGRLTITVTKQVTDPETHVTYTVQIVYYNSPASFSVTDVSDVQTTAHEIHSFNLGDREHIYDPDIGSAPFFDTPIPYVAGSGHIVSAVGPASIPSGDYLLNLHLVTLDPETGKISYDASAFRFLADGETAVYTITFVSSSGPDTSVQTLILTITGTNDTPVFDVHDTPIAFSETPHVTGAADDAHAHIVPITLLFRDEDFSDRTFTIVKSVVSVEATGALATADVSKLPHDLLAYLTLSDPVKDPLDGSSVLTGAAGEVDGVFKAPDSDFDFLAAGEQIKIVYSVQRISDPHHAFDTQTITVVITGTNDAPVIDAIAQHNLVEQEDTSPLVSQPIAVTFTDVDLNDVGHTARISHVSASGVTTGLPSDPETLLTSLILFGAVTKAAGSSSGHVNMTFSAGSGVFDYLAQDEVVLLTYTVEVDDHDGGVATQTFVIKVTGTNDAPIAVADTNTGAAVVEAGNNVDGSVFAGNATASGNVLANDTDVDLTDTHVVTGVAAGVALGAVSGHVNADVIGTYGTLHLNGDGSWTYILNNDDPDTNSLAAGQHVQDVFTYTMSDEHGATSTTTLSIDITGSNDSPHTNQSPFAITDTNLGPPVVEAGVGPANTPKAGLDHASGNVLANDTDVDTGDTKTVQGIVAGISALVLTTGVGSAVVGTYGTLHLNADGSWTYSLNNGDADTDALAAGQTGHDVFTYTMRDAAGATSSATLTIDVTGTNDAPVAMADTNSGAEDGTITGSVASNDHDVDTGAVLAYTLDHPVEGMTLHTDGSYTLDASNAAYQHLAAGATQDIIASYTVTDEDGATDTATLTITLTGVNDAPVVAAALTDHVDEGAALFTRNLLDGASDVDDGETATLSIANVRYSVDGGAASATLPHGFVLDADGHTLKVDPVNSAFDHLAAGQSTTVLVSYNVVDIHGAVVAQTETITINGTNDAPVAQADVNSITAGDAPVIGNVLTNDSDVDDGSVLSVSAVVHDAAALDTFTVEGTYGELVITKSTGAYTYTLGTDLDLNDPVHAAQAAAVYALGPSDHRIDSFTYTASDGQLTDTAELSITVNGMDKAPVLNADNLSIVENGGGVTKVDGLAVFDVGDEDNLTITAVADHGTVSTSVAHVPLANGLNESLADINATLNSGIVYRPNNNPDNQKIVDHVLVTVTDSHGLSDSLNLVFKQSGEGGAILQGTEGKDIFFATGGNDTFVFNADFANNGSFGHDTIRGFDVYHDVIGINGIQEDLAYLYAHATSVNDGADVLITPDNPFDPSHTSTILLKGVTMEQLHGGLSA